MRKGIKFLSVILVALMLVSVPVNFAHAAIGATAVWEIRTSGAATNGGGYTSGGTDYTLQDAAQLTLSDLASDGAGTGISSVTGGFTAAMIGNIIQITGAGDGFTLGFYEVTAYTDTNNITIDRTAGATKTGGTGSVGGCLANISDMSAQVAGNTIYLKSTGTYTLGANFTAAVAGTGALSISWIGYTTTRGDGGKAVIACGAYYMKMSGGFQGVDSLDISGTSGVVVYGGYQGSVRNCKINNTSVTADRVAYQAQSAGSFLITGSEFISDKGLALNVAITTAHANIKGNYIHDSKNGCRLYGGLSSFTFNILDTFTATALDLGTSYGVLVENNTFYNGVTGINGDTAYQIDIRNNIIDSFTTGASWTAEVLQNCWDYNNWNGNTTDVSNVTKGANALALDPQFEGAAGGDFSIGENLKAAGIPGTFPGGLSTGYMDIGAVQREESGGGGPCVGLIGG